MDLNIVSIGRLKNNPLLEIQSDYKKRIIKLGKTIGINNLKIDEGSVSKKNSPTDRREEESKYLEKNLKKDNYNIFLDEAGGSISSIEIAELLSNKLLDYKEMVFFIGGPDGFKTNLIKKSNQNISLGKVTWPHMLLRVMLVEQLYRGITIIKNHPYHRN